MKSKLWIAMLGISAVAMLSGCHKKVASAAPPPPPPPPAASSPASTPAPVREREASTAPTARPPAEQPAQVARTSKQLEDYLNKLLDAYFDFDKSDLRADAQSALNSNSSELRSLLQEFPNTKFVVEGSCDERGSPEYNLALGERRAKAATEFLTQIGVPAERLTTISYGQERPVCTDHDENCWQKNRRAHLSVAN
jgi:peptidoglycan-associated lipoprotein